MRRSAGLSDACCTPRCSWCLLSKCLTDRQSLPEDPNSPTKGKEGWRGTRARGGGKFQTGLAFTAEGRTISRTTVGRDVKLLQKLGFSLLRFDMHA